MAQHDYILENQPGAAFRGDLNAAMQAIVSQNSGSTEPTTTYPYQFWADTTEGILKQRNAANNAWINIFSLSTGAPSGISSYAQLSGATFTGPVSVPSLNGGQLAGMRNKIINGNFSVNQRAVSGTVTLAAGAYGHDRWKAGASGCTYTFSTVQNVTTITITAGSLQQVIEGLNLQSGNHVLSWQGTAQGRVGSGAYGISGAVVGAAVGGTNQTIEFNTGTVALVQYEPGTIATPFEHRNFGAELALCQRYFCKTFPYATAPAQAIGNNIGALGGQSVTNSNAPWVYWSFPVTMRAAPTITTFSPRTADANWRDGANTTSITVNFAGGGASEAGIYISGSVSASAQNFFIHATAAIEL